MKIFFGIVIRTAKVNKSGRLVKVDWIKHNIEKDILIFPKNPNTQDDPNPSGGTRGCRGIGFTNDKVIVANYHSLEVFDMDLNHKRTISHPLMACLHEIFVEHNQYIWVSSTMIDAALKYDLSSGQLIQEFWPRDMKNIQFRLNLKPTKIDQAEDNRYIYREFFNNKNASDFSHLHLNAVSVYNSEVFALFNEKGVIANLSRDEILIQDNSIKSCHNLIIRQGKAFVNDTIGKRVMIYDVKKQALIKEIDLMGFKEILELQATAMLKYNFKPKQILKNLLVKAKLKRKTKADIIFIRGMDMINEDLFIGISPASIVHINWEKEMLYDLFTYSLDPKYAVHGLKVCNFTV